ncbi:6-O-methylguanine DNA methyltransferase, DNA binding domain protein, partial [Bacteroides pyogenes F0041]
FFSKPAGFFSVNKKVWMMRDYKVDKARFSDDFRCSVYEIVAQIPPGKVVTYGEIATLLGMPGRSRLVGKALKEVPPQFSLPCHRVVNAAGRLVPGWAEQKDLLLAEGVRLKANGCVDLKRFRMKT